MLGSLSKPMRVLTSLQYGAVEAPTSARIELVKMILCCLGFGSSKVSTPRQHRVILVGAGGLVNACACHKRNLSVNLSITKEIR